MSKKFIRPIDNAWAGAKVLHELLNTPHVRSLHFELDVAADEIPTVKYSIERFAYIDEVEE